MAGREPGGRLVQAGEPRSIRLEAVRAVAALAVIVEHCYGYAHNYDPAAIFGSFRDRLLAATGNGVDLFYALSGYLLFLPFARWCWADAEAPDLGRYSRNRAVRILPLYYVVIFTYLVVEGATRSQWWAFLTFTQNFFRGSLLQIDAPTWSIVVEVEFYVVLPLVGWLLFRTTRGSALRGAAALAGLVGLTLALNLSVTGDSPLSWQYSPATNAFYFLPGMVLAYLACQRPERVTSRLPRLLRRSDLWVATGVALWMVHAWLWSHNELLALGCFLVLAACVLPLDRGLATTVLQLRVLGLVGMVSYSIYLWHAPIVEALARVVPAGFPGLLVASVAASLAVGTVSYAVVERPFLLLRRSWSSASPAPATSTTKTSSGVR
jgi:peptidoglycan/LPS O-acetylase OafA/YrhL